MNEFASPLRQAKINATTSDTSLLYFNRLYTKMYMSDESKLNIQLHQRIREFLNLEYRQRERMRDTLSDSVQRTKNITFTLTALSIIAGISVVSFLAYRISKRIMKMVNMADNISAGNYQVHTEEEGRDELSRLARSLNHMAKVLSHNINELQNKNQELDQFAHIVSHDMKAPLRGIDNVVTWIEEDHKEELSPKVAEYIQLIKGRVTRGENLINGLLAYARIGKEEYTKEDVDVRELITDILDNFALKPGFKVNVSGNLPTIATNKVPLFQVFSNLISNAIKYNDKAEGLIKIYNKEHHNHYEFFVEDNGMGINQNHHKKVFKIFQTLQERDSFESTGVGLAIVKKILDARQEEIRLESKPGKGTTFSFTWKK
jgi:signal transduction histidine kinase